jgi:hypothetical protein
MRYFEFPMWSGQHGKLGLGELVDALPPNELHWLMTEFDGFYRRDRPVHRNVRAEIEASQTGIWFTWPELLAFADTLGDTDWCIAIATHSRDSLLIQLPIAEEAFARMPGRDYFAGGVAPLCPAADCIIEAFDSTTWSVSFRERFDPMGHFSPDRIRRRPPIPGQRVGGPARPIHR